MQKDKLDLIMKDVDILPDGIQIINGIKYKFKRKSFWDPVKKQGSHLKLYIGKFSPDGKFIYSDNYLNILKQYEKKPAQKIASVNTAEHQNQVPAVSLHHGATYLLDKLSNSFGVDEDLKKCFPDDYDMILSLAYYIILSPNNGFYMAKYFSRTHTIPYDGELSSPRISELLVKISEDAKLKFFKLQTDRRLENEFLAYDTTSISSYNNKICEVKWGYNKDDKKLKQINLALIIGEKSLLPVYYRKLPGNISDAKTIEKLIIDSGFLNLNNVKFAMDRGFWSYENIRSFMKCKIPFIIGARNNLSLIDFYMNKAIASGNNHTNYINKYRIYGHTFNDSIKVKNDKNKGIFKKQPIIIHIIYDDERAVAEKRSFYSKLHDAIDATYKNEASDKQKRIINKFCESEIKKNKIVNFNFNDDKINERIAKFGYFGLISNSISDVHDVVRIYRQKDVVEKGFSYIKNTISNKKTTVEHTIEGIEGHTFIKFIALILLSGIHKVMDDNDLDEKFHSMAELLNELNIIQKFIYPNTKIHYSEITKKQIQIYEYFKINPPSNK